jgi:ribose transport system ATP-binding protein
LAGMGWESVPGLLFGVEAVRSGSLFIRGSRHDLRGWSPRAAVSVGLALVPGDRLHDGGIQTASVRENLTMPTLGRYFERGLLRSSVEKRRSREILEAYDVSPPQPERVFGTLSGGNQQKAILGKWFETRPEVLLLHEPVQGVDVGAKRAIYRRIRRASDEGTAVVIASAEVEDLVHLCDRVFVFRDGVVHGVFSEDTLNYEQVMSCAVQGSNPQLGSRPSLHEVGL